MNAKKLTAIILAAVMTLCALPLTTSGGAESIFPVAHAAFGLPKMKTARVSVVPGQKVAQSLVDSNGKKISNDKVTWASKDKSVAKVSSKGNITGVKAGTAVITAKYNGHTYYCTVTCKNPTFRYSKKTIAVGEKFLQKLLDASGKEISYNDITWKSADKNIASISSKGTVTGKKAGTVKISATYKGKTYSFTVTVEKAPIVVPTTIDEIVKLSNSALDNTKQQKNFTITEKEPDLTMNILIDGQDSSTKLDLGSSVRTTKYTFTNGKTKYGDTVADIVTGKSLKASYVSSASAKKSGDNIILTIQIKPETATWSKSKTTHAYGNEALFNAELGEIDSVLQSVKIDYPATVLVRTINKNGLIIKDSITAPAEMKVTLKLPGQEKAASATATYTIKTDSTINYR